MNDALARHKKMQVLLRLREFEKEGAAFAHLHAQQELLRLRQVFEGQRRRYEAAHALGAQRLNPDLHGWRLASISQLRVAALAADADSRQAAQYCADARQELAFRKLETRVAEQAETASGREVTHRAGRLEQDELLDLQLFRKREAP